MEKSLEVSEDRNVHMKVKTLLFILGAVASGALTVGAFGKSLMNNITGNMAEKSAVVAHLESIDTQLVVICQAVSDLRVERRKNALPCFEMSKHKKPNEKEQAAWRPE